MTISGALTRIDAALSDGTINRNEWSGIRGELADRVPMASEPARRLLQAFNEGRVDFTARNEVLAFLRASGYDLAEGRLLDTPAIRTERIRAEAVGEDDPTFARLATAVGVPRDHREVVGVLDNGFDLSSPLLINRSVEGRDLVHRDDNLTPMDHGTATASISATGSDRLRAMPLEVLDGGAPAVVSGIDYAAAHGVRVMNMSLAFYQPKDSRMIIEEMRRHPEVTFVVAAGNDSGDLGEGALAGHSAAQHLPNLIIVAAADRDGSPAAYTNRGSDFVHVAERGSTLLVPEANDADRVQSGTSLASPRVASLVARLHMLAPSLTPAQLREVLVRSSSRDPRWDGLAAAGGTVDAARAENLAAVIRLLGEGVAEADIVRRLELPAASSAQLLRDARSITRA